MIYPPPGTVIPEVEAAVVIRLKRAPQVAALCADRVSLILKQSWQMPQYAILVHRVGGMGPDQETGRHYARLDVRFFGPGTDFNIRMRHAMELWRVAHPVLCPPPRLRIPVCFQAAHCIVQHVRQDAEPIRMTEPNTDWAVVLVPYVVTYMEEPI